MSSSELLPEGWSSIIAADCFDLVSTNGIKVKTKDCQTAGLYPVIDQGQEFISGFVDDSTKLIRIDAPVVVFGDHTRNIKWVDFDFVPGADGTKILSPQEFLFPRLAYYLLNDLEIPDKGYSRHFKFLKELKFAVPPLAEQKIIADKLDTLLAQVETTKARLERIPNILKSFRQSVLAAAVSGKLTEGWRKLNPSCKVSSLDEINSYWDIQYLNAGKKRPSLKLIGSGLSKKIPPSWLSTNIGFVFDVFVGATPSRKIESYWNGDVAWVSSSEVAFCRIRSTKETVSEMGLAKTSTIVHPPGTVMLAMIGQGKTRGQVAILDIYACHNQNTAALRVPPGFVVSEYLYFYLSKQYEETRRVGGGNNQQALNKSFVQSLEFPLPPFDEQTEIVRRVEELFAFADTIEQKANAALDRVNNLTQSILAKAFRGELTADWRAANPDLISGENSAEALLEKIKAERKAMKKQPK